MKRNVNLENADILALHSKVPMVSNHLFNSGSGKHPVILPASLNTEIMASAPGFSFSLKTECIFWKTSWQCLLKLNTCIYL